MSTKQRQATINEKIVGTRDLKVPFLFPPPPKQCCYARNVSGCVPDSILNITSVQNNIELGEGVQIVNIFLEICSISVRICTFALMFQQIFSMIVGLKILQQSDDLVIS